MTVRKKLLLLSRQIETQMHVYRNQLQELMDEAEETEEQIDLESRGMYVNMVHAMEEVAPDAPCFYDLLNTMSIVKESDRSSLDFFFDSVNENLKEELTELDEE